MILLTIIFIIIGFNCLRSSLRGIQLSLIDSLQIFIATVGGFVFSPLLINRIMKFDFYFNLKTTLANIINYNSVILNININDQENYIENLNLPKNISDILIMNNTPEVYAALNVMEEKDYIVAAIMFLVSRFIAFCVFYVMFYLIFYYIRLIYMPKIKFQDFGLNDKIFGGLIGVGKGLFYFFVIMIFLLMYFSSIGFAHYQMLLDSVFVVRFFNNYDFLLEPFLINRFY